MKWRNTVFLIIQKIWGTYEPGRVKFHRRVYPGERGRKCGRSRMNKIQEWKIKRRRVTHMTVAHTCKRGAPAFTRKGTTYSLKAPRPTAIRGRVHHPLEKFSFFFQLFPSSPRICLPSPFAAAPRYRRRPIQSALRKGWENRFRASLQSAIQYGNLFQFYMNFPFALFPPPPFWSTVAFHSSAVLYQELLYARVSSLSRFLFGPFSPRVLSNLSCQAFILSIMDFFQVASTCCAGAIDIMNFAFC